MARRIPDLLLPLCLLAVLLALTTPSHALARRSDLLLAALVLSSALGVAPKRLLALRDRWRQIAALAVLPILVLAPLAWAIGRLFAGPVRDGALTLGLAPTEVAAIGLAGLVGDAALATAAVTGSLVASALLGPLGVALVAGTAHVGTASLLARFAAIVLAPLAAGLALRACSPALRRTVPATGAASTLTLAALLYAALSGARPGHDLGPALAASGLFLAASGAFALVWTRLAPPATRATAGLALCLRDFAVAAALATQAFGTRAAGVAGVYGVLMLLAGLLAVGALRRR